VQYALAVRVTGKNIAKIRKKTYINSEVIRNNIQKSGNKLEFFWNVRQRRMVILYRRFDTTYRPNLKGQEVQKERISRVHRCGNLKTGKLGKISKHGLSVGKK
jgi:hypothetical protein